MEPERCAECGFDSTRLTVQDAIAALRSMGRRWREAFKGVHEDRLRRRPGAGIWSPLEYAAHTRDVIGDLSVEMALTLEGRQPKDGDFPPTLDEPDVRGMSPESILAQLAANADAMAERASRPAHEGVWHRTLREDGPDAGWLLRHAVHDASHHLKDVEHDLLGK